MSNQIDPGAAAQREADRQPDGKFGPSSAAESTVVLDPADRATQIMAGEHVGAATATNARAGGSRRGELEGHRDAATMTGEYGHEAGEYPKMPVETPRRTYSGPVGQLVMPSRASVLRMGAATNGTFDVPVSHDGNVSWVRVTPGKDGAWEAEPAGAPGRAQARTCEAVCAVLEARQPTTALTGQDTASLMERRRARMEARGATQDDITSSWIKSTGYQADSQMMVMRTRDTQTKTGEHRPGHVYGFRDVPPEHYSAMAKADRPGAVFNDLIKGRHSRVAVDQCGSCGAYYSTGSGAGHTCVGGNTTTARPGAPTEPHPSATSRISRFLRRG